ncbi:MAG TPA: hypothetical protein GX399_03715 [Xanthomonadaceae bacterium]|nr:hypothetical protein [Xanthomonadaceae bacterium]
MWQVTELIPYIPANIENKAPRLFFALYYKAADGAFKKADQTWRDEVKKRYNFSVARDEFFERQVMSEDSFKTAWNDLCATAIRGGFEVWAGNILTHASKDMGGDDGLEFSRSDAEDGTLKHSEIVALKKLPWAKNGFLILSGCNTGLSKERKWIPAHSFALAQRVSTVGQAGYAYFSKEWNDYQKTSESDSKMCLWAYDRGKNTATLIFGSGRRVAGIVFKV